MVVFFITMVQRIGANSKRKQNHPKLKIWIVQHIDAQQRKGTKKQRQ